MTIIIIIFKGRRTIIVQGSSFVNYK